MEAISLGIDRHPVVRFDLWKQLPQLRGRRDQTLYFKLFEQHLLSSKSQPQAPNKFQSSKVQNAKARSLFDV